MTLVINWNEAAIELILEDVPISNYMLDIGNSIADSIERDAGDHRTGDNHPRHIKRKYAKAINPGRGYSHYQDAVDVHLGMAKRMAAVYVIASRHVMTQEYGWHNWITGTSYPGRYYMTLSLMEHRVP